LVPCSQESNNEGEFSLNISFSKKDGIATLNEVIETPSKSIKIQVNSDNLPSLSEENLMFALDSEIKDKKNFKLELKNDSEDNIILFLNCNEKCECKIFILDSKHQEIKGKEPYSEVKYNGTCSRKEKLKKGTYYIYPLINNYENSEGEFELKCITKNIDNINFN
jgi:hypothetical protein